MLVVWNVFPTSHICDYNHLVPAAAANATLRHHPSSEEADTGRSSPSGTLPSQSVLGTSIKNGPPELISQLSEELLICKLEGNPFPLPIRESAVRFILFSDPSHGH